MRIAAFSDIHSNIFALLACLEDADRRGFDLAVNLGDILYGPIAPRATYELLGERDILTIRGNQDRQIYEADETELGENPTMAFIHEDLGREPLDWMRGLPFDSRITDGVYACHGTPENDLVYLLEEVTSGRPVLRTDDEISNLTASRPESLILCGHTHIPRLVMLADGRTVANPGSVGLPAYFDDMPCPHAMENHSPHASYILLDQDKGGAWTAGHIKVAYDHALAAREAEKRNRPDWVHALTTGRVQT